MTNEACQYMIFKLGDELFAINVSQVREVLEVLQITKVPTAPAYMRGVVNVRGQATDSGGVGEYQRNGGHQQGNIDEQYANFHRSTDQVVVSLQSEDIARQRVEHVQEAVRRVAASLYSGACPFHLETF